MSKKKDTGLDEEKLEALIKSFQPELIHPSQNLTYGSFSGELRPINLVDANIFQLPYGETKEEIEALSKIMKVYKHSSLNQTANITDIVKDLVKKETNLDLEKYNLSINARGASKSIAEVLEKNIDEQKNIIIFQNPNWIFDRLLGTVPGSLSLAVYAKDYEEYISKIEKMDVSLLKKVAAVILVDPSNPSGDFMNQKHAERLDQLSEKYSILPIFDDVFRGLRPDGEKHSASEFSNKGIIIETTSKRYGYRGIGITWILAPKEYFLNLPEIDIEDDGISKSLASTILEGLIKTNYGDKIRNYLINNTKAFEQGFKENLFSEDFATLKIPFQGSPIITVKMNYHHTQADEIARQCVEGGVQLTSGYDWLRSSSLVMDQDQIKGFTDPEINDFLRICPTKETPDRCYYAGKIVAEVINSNSKPKKLFGLFRNLFSSKKTEFN